MTRLAPETTTPFATVQPGQSTSPAGSKQIGCEQSGGFACSWRSLLEEFAGQSGIDPDKCEDVGYIPIEGELGSLLKTDFRVEGKNPDQHAALGAEHGATAPVSPTADSDPVRSTQGRSSIRVTLPKMLSPCGSAEARTKASSGVEAGTSVKGKHQFSDASTPADRSLLEAPVQLAPPLDLPLQSPIALDSITRNAPRGLIAETDSSSTNQTHFSSRGEVDASGDTQSAFQNEIEVWLQKNGVVGETSQGAL